MGNGIEKPAVPLAAFTLNFSSILFNAPPPFGSSIFGMLMLLDSVAFSFANEEMSLLLIEEVVVAVCCLFTPV